MYAQAIHEKTFLPYKNAFSGKDVVLVCPGPSAKGYVPLPECLHVGVNGAIYLKNIRLDYLFIQDYTRRQKRNEHLVEDALTYIGAECKKFFGLFPQQRARDLQPSFIDRIPLRYFDRPDVSRYILEDMPLHNFAYDLSIEPVGDFCATPFSALQFIFYAHPKRLYLVGWDCTDAGYAYASQAGERQQATYQSDIMKDYVVPFAATNYPDTEIISINPVGLRGMFQDEDR